MSKFLRYFMRGASIVSLITLKLPLYMADGKVTVDEMVDFIKSVLDIGGWKAHLEIPDDLKEKSVSFTLEQ